jgi:hypothetical protein
MAESNSLASRFLLKLEEQIERTQHLITLIPSDKLEWRPRPDSLRVCDLLGHLLECLAGFCATLNALNSERLAHFGALREKTVNHCCGIEEASKRINDYELGINQGFALLTDADLAIRVPTVFVVEGEVVLTLLLGNLEHLINHKYQLFSYLKLLGVAVTTRDLYKLQ